MNSSKIKFVFANIILFSLLSGLFAKPIIGIYTNPIINDTDDIKETFINLNYVKWLEAAGAEVVPIHPWLNDKDLDTILSKVNGVYFQGGSTTLRLDSPYVITASKILTRIIQEKDLKDNALPLFATCQGFELLHVLVSGSSSVLETFSSWNITSNLEISTDINKTSKLFSLFTDQDVLNMKARPLTAEFHRFGISLDGYNMFRDLEAFFVQTSFAFDNNNKFYIASVEAREYPVFALQFHPEKTSFDRLDSDNIPQGIEAVRISQNFVNLFVNVARTNKNSMTEEDKKNFGLINSFEKDFVVTESSSIIYSYKKDAANNIVRSIKFLQ